MHTALILAGGFGTRLRSVVADRPKPLALVGDRPFLALQLDWLAAQGVATVALAVHHMAEQIVAFAGHDYDGPLTLHIVREEVPLGTGGAIVNAFRTLGLRDDVLVVNGDTAFAFPLLPMEERHRRLSRPATMVAARVADAARYGRVMLDEAAERVAGFADADGVVRPGWVNAGAYILSPNLFAGEAEPVRAFSLERDFFPGLAAAGDLSAHAVEAAEAFFDIGTPEAYAEFNSRSGA